MNIQLLIVLGCILAAVAFIAYKIFVSLSRKGAPACSSCPNEKACSSNQGSHRPPCALQELRPKK